MREAGVGDLGVGKNSQNGAGFYGRAAVYDEAMERKPARRTRQKEALSLSRPAIFILTMIGSG